MTAAASAGPDVFAWFPGTGGTTFAFATIGEIPVKVVRFNLLDLILIEEVDGQRMPVRTISRIELDGTYPEKILIDLGVKP